MLTFHNRWNIEKFPFQLLPEMQTLAVTPLQKSLLHYQEMADNNKTDLRENKNGDPAANGAANNLQENWKSSDRPTRGAYTYDVHGEGGGVETYSVRWVVLLVIHSVVIFCRAFLTCSTGSWADAATIVQPNGPRASRGHLCRG